MSATAESPAWLPVDAAAQRDALAEAARAAGVLQLPFRRDTWRGPAGNFAGAGVGSSIDFQDHRPYQPGDDPRYINWQAYARSGHYTMKLYREEVSPLLDWALDVSPSLFAEESKQRRLLELACFVHHSAARAGSLTRFWLLGRERPRLLEADALAAATLQRAAPLDDDADPRAPLLDAIEWRPHALRVLVSDLLFPGEPSRVLQPLLARRGTTVILAPWTRAEADPDWDGNLDLRDCESRRHRERRFHPGLLRRYRESYRQHFALWHEACQRHGVILARVGCDQALTATLLGEALSRGAVTLQPGA